jgi:K+-transporting ATPase ATPase C chain
MKKYFLPAIKMLLLTMILFGIIFPLLIVGIAKVIAPNEGKGKTVILNGQIIGFELIGQSFTSDSYFNSRPSAVNYNAAATGGSNKGPNNSEYLKVVEERISDILAKNPAIKKEQIPVDLITSSGGGLDPHISVQAALIQIPRIAKIREMNVNELKQLVNTHTERPLFGLFGTSRINVLNLNLALDRAVK